jgi:hypothetical protein
MESAAMSMTNAWSRIVAAIYDPFLALGELRARALRLEAPLALAGTPRRGWCGR